MDATGGPNEAETPGQELHRQMRADNANNTHMAIRPGTGQCFHERRTLTRLVKPRGGVLMAAIERLSDDSQYRTTLLLLLLLLLLLQQHP